MVFLYLCRLTLVGCTLEAISRHEAEHSQLEKSLEDQHVSHLCTNYKSLVPQLLVDNRISYEVSFLGIEAIL